MPETEKLYAQVIVDLVSNAVDRPFQYLIPSHLRQVVKLGSQVVVPFRSQKKTAYVVALEKEPAVENPREILALPEPPYSLLPEFMELSYWLSRRFFSRWIEAIHLCLPPAGKRLKTKEVEYVFPLMDREKLREMSSRLKKKAPRQSLILEHLAPVGEKGLPWAKLRIKTGSRRESLLSLEGKGYVKIEKIPYEKLPRQGAATLPKNKGGLSFSAQQKKAWQEIEKGFSGSPKHFLLYGVTGSGKTELYLRAAAKVLKQGRTVLFLVPEIMLTPQIIDHFNRRFTGQFALLHSKLTPGERFREWKRIESGQARFVLGARSAVFAPLKNIGLIIMDEEHENTYKQDDAPRYHTRDVAKWRAEYHDAIMLMGSATPSLESYWEARKQKLKLLQMTKRIGNRSLPAVQLVDMRHEFKQKNRGIFSRLLLRAMEDTLSRGEQLILFLNRRGFAGFQLCRECGWVMQCPHCAVSLTYHASPEHLQCHYCGYKQAVPQSCPRCRSMYLRNFGLGTQRVEKVMRGLFPQVGVMRMDSDTAGRKGSYERIWRNFEEKKASVLIGTQMIAKGLDFPDVTLVGVIAADITLHLPDFRAGERTFQLLSQVAGRAGRGDKAGRVIIQTYTPWHYSIQAAAVHNYPKFTREELKRRQALFYPPFSEILLFNCSSPCEQEARQAAEELKKRLIVHLPPGKEGAEGFLGPSPAPLQRIEDRFRYHLLYRGFDLQKYGAIVRETVWDFTRRVGEDTWVTVDFNPLKVL
ncbi:MAG: primosomal protein N' [Firmicutes bacterium]|nr:primosomal protein N' [Bacillota bacterium]